MRHGKKINHLSRKASHRRLMLSNMASSLILNKRITTTVPKAKALRKYVEPLVTKAKTNTTHSRRVVFSYLQDKKSVDTLFGEVASRITSRPGGYTRIIKMAQTRLGDGAETCLMELVDFNEIYKQESSVKKTKTRRSRRGTTTTKLQKETTPDTTEKTSLPEQEENSEVQGDLPTSEHEEEDSADLDKKKTKRQDDNHHE